MLENREPTISWLYLSRKEVVHGRPPVLVQAAHNGPDTRASSSQNIFQALQAMDYVLV
jgi:hypothetical protein